MLKVGEPAPDFEAYDQDGKKFKLSDHFKRNPVVLYFYPKDETPGCTAEACAFRDNWERLQQFGTEVFGISSDSVDKHRKFREHHSLPFTLLSDPGAAIRKLYDVKGMLIPPRVTFVIDRSGRIRHIYNSQLNPKNHVEEALESVKKIAEEKESGST
ncbi:MAG: peroxiredoxin [Candidatus Thermoplasmatota archaeon]|nr:peroxiredoxin [Candidatus Thermoplasmatota archaeon]MCL5730667.1 peroxiredoxin [Candidatus Thermoplasmatota archaeon]